jgi:type IV pilus assembly protein PilE
MKAKQMGFTLIELMITVAIIGILSSVGYPSYMSHIQKAKRSEAQAALVSMATAMEQWRVENNNNYGDGTDSIFATQVPTDGTGTKTYMLSFTTSKSSPTLTVYDQYTLTATPVTPQDTDVCHVLTLKSTGEKGANGKSPDEDNCWE